MFSVYCSPFSVGIWEFFILGLGLRVLGCRVHLLLTRAVALEERDNVYGIGLGVQGSGFWVQDPKGPMMALGGGAVSDKRCSPVPRAHSSVRAFLDRAFRVWR